AAHVEANALGQRQRATPVDRARLPAHVGLPGIGTGLASAARFLLTAEGTADLSSRGADVDVGDPAIAAERRQEALRDLQAVGEERGGEAVRGLVLSRDRLVE